MRSRRHAVRVRNPVVEVSFAVGLSVATSSHGSAQSRRKKLAFSKRAASATSAAGAICVSCLQLHDRAFRVCSLRAVFAERPCFARRAAFRDGRGGRLGLRRHRDLATAGRAESDGHDRQRDRCFEASPHTHR